LARPVHVVPGVCGSLLT